MQEVSGSIPLTSTKIEGPLGNQRAFVFVRSKFVFDLETDSVASDTLIFPDQPCGVVTNRRPVLSKRNFSENGRACASASLTRRRPVVPFAHFTKALEA